MRKTDGTNAFPGVVPTFSLPAGETTRVLGGPLPSDQARPQQAGLTAVLDQLNQMGGRFNHEQMERFSKTVADHQGAKAGSTARKIGIGDADPAVEKRIQRHVLQSTVGRSEAQLITHIARYLPDPAVQAIEQMQTSIRLLASTDEMRTPSPRLSKEVGPGAALLTALQWTAEDATTGYFSNARNEVTVRDADPITAPSTAIHELMHAIDFGLMRDGLRASERNGWWELFENAQQTGRFPSGYASESPTEMFAEAATMYLSPHVAREDGRYVTRDRAYLQKHHPKVFAFIDQLFREELPARVAEKTLAGMAESREWLTHFIDKSWELYPKVATMPTREVLTLARRHLERAGFDGMPSDLEIAQALVEVCLHRISDGEKVTIGNEPYAIEVLPETLQLLRGDIEALRRRFST